MKFQRWLNSDFQPWVSATIEASSNGTSWTTVWSNGGNEFADAAWTPQTLDVSAVADDQPAVYIRWGYRVHRADAVAYSGWNIDDVQIWGLDATPSQPGCTGDANCDGAINWRDIDYFVAAMGNNIAAWEAMFYPDGATCPFANNDVNGDGTVNWRDIDSLVATMNVTCP